MYLDLFDSSRLGDSFTTFSIREPANFDVRRSEDNDAEPVHLRLCGREFGVGAKLRLNLTDDEAMSLHQELATFFANDTAPRKYPVEAR
jgi:hypothetical protein